MPAVIREVLKHYPEITQPWHEPQDLGNAGGLSGARFWKYRSALGELVLKRWPSPGPTRSTLRRNHDWLRQASPLPFVPLPILADNGETFLEILGHLWELQPWMPGTAPTADPSDPAQVGLAFEALAAFHDQLAEESRNGVSPGLAARLEEVDGWISRDFARVERIITNQTQDPALELAQQWLTLARDQAPRIKMLLESVARVAVRLQPCLKDIRREHWLFEGGHLSGLVDFGAMDRDNVATDLSRLASDWFGDDPVFRDLALKSYTSVRRLDPSEIGLIGVFDQSADLLVGGHWVRWLLIDRREFETPGAIIRGLSKGVGRLSKRAESRRPWK